MPYQNLENGLYLVRQRSVKNGMQIWHYGILDVGNKLGLILAFTASIEPLIVHQTPPQVRADRLSETGHWEMQGKVDPSMEKSAISRIKEALKNPGYDLFGHNCEHFARFVTTGVKESKQIQSVAWSCIGLVAMGWALSRRA